MAPGLWVHLTTPINLRFYFHNVIDFSFNISEKSAEETYLVILGGCSFLNWGFQINRGFTGLLTLIVLLAGCLIWKNYKKSKCKTLWNISSLLGAIFIMMALYYIWPKADFDISLTDYTLLDRIRQKIWKFSHGNLADLLYDRSAERLVLHPKYLLYGAGEGMFERFLPGDYVNQITPGVFDVVRVNEIHSSLFSVWFSYGIIPLLGLLYWGGKNIRFCDKWQLIVVMALIVESFSLMNCRQPFFWFIIIFASCYKKMGRERQDKGGVFLN